MKTNQNQLDSEKTVLGGILKDRSCIEKISRQVGPDDFLLPEHRVCFSELLAYNESIEPIDNNREVEGQKFWDVLCFIDFLNSRKNLYPAGGRDYLIDLLNYAIGGFNALDHADRVFENSQKRKAVEIVSHYTEVFNNGSDLAESLSQLQGELDTLKEQAELKNNSSTLPLLSMSDIQKEEISWLWYNKLVNRGLNIIAGKGEAGKTTLAIDIIGKVTTGRKFIDCENTIKPGIVIYLGEEDDPNMILRPRMEAHGVDLHKVKILNLEKLIKTQGHVFNLEEHLHLLRNTVESLGDVRLIVFDPLNGYLGKIDSNNDARTRSVLIPLQNLAKHYQLAIIGLAHLNKKADMEAIDRVMGSKAFANTSRAVWMVTYDKKTKLRYFQAEKTNYSIDPTNLSFKIIDGTVSFLDGTTDKTADEVLQSGRQKSDTTVGCIEWLRKKLQYNSILSSEIGQEAKNVGFTLYALNEAKRELQVVSKPNGIGGKWMLSLPESGGNND